MPNLYTNIETTPTHMIREFRDDIDPIEYSPLNIYEL